MGRNGEYMALYNLNRIQNSASSMQSLMQQNDTLPEWAKSKLTQSRSHLSNVANYKRSKPLGGPGSHRTFDAAPGENHHHAKPLGSFYRIYDQLGATQVTGRQAGLVIAGALLGNTLLAKTLEEIKWREALDVGFITAGFGVGAAGVFTVSRGMRNDDVARLAAGGALTGLGLFYLMTGNL